jgi:hypothetical protein
VTLVRLHGLPTNRPAEKQCRNSLHKARIPKCNFDERLSGGVVAEVRDARHDGEFGNNGPSAQPTALLDRCLTFSRTITTTASVDMASGVWIVILCNSMHRRIQASFEAHQKRAVAAVLGHQRCFALHQQVREHLGARCQRHTQNCSGINMCAAQHSFSNMFLAPANRTP